MFEGLKQLIKVPTAAERERAYLEQSVDRYDLEMRQREIDRGRSVAGTSTRSDRHPPGRRPGAAIATAALGFGPEFRQRQIHRP